MAGRRSAISATLGAVVAAFAAGAAVDRYLLPASGPETAPASDRADAARGAPPANLTPDGATLAAGPARKPSRAAEAGGAAASEGGSVPKPEGARAGEAVATVEESVKKLRDALRRIPFGTPESTEEGNGAASFLEAHASPDDREAGLLVARWLAARGRDVEATRRVLARIGTRTPTSAEISWLSQVDPRAGVAAARTLVSRKPGSPDALESLAEALAAAGDTAGAFDAYAAALRVGLSAGNGASELARLDAERAIPVLAELYAGRDVDAGVRALVEAYLRVGRVADAGRELIRVARAGGGASGLIEAAAILVAEETAKALAPQMDDLGAAAQEDAGALRAYGVALGRSGHREEAVAALHAVFESDGGEEALVELLRFDLVDSRAYVESHLSPFVGREPLQRIRLLGLLGRHQDLEAVMEFVTRSLGANEDLWVALAYAEPDRAIEQLRRGLGEARLRAPPRATEWAVSLARALTAAGRVAEAKAAWADIPSRDLDLEALVERATLR